MRAAETVASAATAPIADTVIQVDDKLYSAQKLAEVHPGGNIHMKRPLYV